MEGVVSSDNDQFRLSGSPACNQPWVAIAVRGKKLIENKITPGIEDRTSLAETEFRETGRADLKGWIGYRKGGQVEIQSFN